MGVGGWHLMDPLESPGCHAFRWPPPTCPPHSPGLLPFPLQTFLCFGQSVASTRWLIQDEMHIRNTQCDNCIIGTMIFFQYLSCICSVSLASRPGGAACMPQQLLLFDAPAGRAMQQECRRATISLVACSELGKDIALLGGCCLFKHTLGMVCTLTLRAAPRSARTLTPTSSQTSPPSSALACPRPFMPADRRVHLRQRRAGRDCPDYRLHRRLPLGLVSGTPACLQ